MTSDVSRAVRRSMSDPHRLVRFGLAVLVALAIAFVIHVVTADGVVSMTGGRLGGDWAPFRTAGELVRTDPALVLRADAQQAAMADYFDGGFLVFPYPPLVAYLFVPGTWVGFTIGYVVFVVLLAGVAVAAIRCTMDTIGVQDPTWRRVGLLGGMTFAPVFRGYTGAQNSAVSLLLLAGGVLLVKRERPWAAGIVLGALWYKPQFAVPLLGLLVALRHARTAVAMGLTGVAFWAANAMVWGVDWVDRWWTGVVAVVDQGNIGFSTDITVSVVEWIRWTAGDGGTALGVVVAGLLGVVAIGIGWRWTSPEDLLPLASAALLVTAPHALIYELTLLVPVLGGGLMAGGRRRVPAAVALWALAALVLVVRHPMVRIPYVFGVVVWWVVQRRRADEFPSVHEPIPARATAG